MSLAGTLVVALVDAGLPLLARLIEKVLKPGILNLAKWIYDLVEDWAEEQKAKYPEEELESEQKRIRFENLYASAVRAGVTEPLLEGEVRALIEITHAEKGGEEVTV